MSRLVLLERGEDLSEATVAVVRAATAPVALRLIDPPPPFRDGQIVHVRGVLAGESWPGALLLCAHGGAFHVRAGRAGEAGRPDEVLARVIALQRGPVRVSLDHGPLRRLPARWLPAAVDALEGLHRLRHPLSPPPFQGSPGALLAAVQAKYSGPAEIAQYARVAPDGADALEMDLVCRHVRAGGRLLDVGCGAGREAVAFARAGFQVVGIDIAPGMVEAARATADRAGVDAAFRVQSATDLDDPPGTYDGAYCLGAFQHIPGRALRVETLRRVGRALTPGGVLILGVSYRGARGLVSRSRLVDLLRRLLSGTRRRAVVSEPGDTWMRDVSEASDPRVTVFFHEYAGPGEVRAEVEAGGFIADEAAPSWWVCRRPA
jgi:SAM-dependent methyltransferase